MSQQYPYPDDPGYRPPEQSGYPDQPVNYELEPRPGYDPTSSMPVMGGPTPPPQQPGYDPGTSSMPVTGPPHQSAYTPSQPAPPAKSNSGMIIGIAVGVIVLVLVAGAVVWFSYFRGGPQDPGGPGGGGPADSDAAGGTLEVFPGSYSVSEKPPDKDSTWGIDKADGYDKCATVNLEPVKKVVPIEGTPKGDTDANDDGTGRMSCQGNLSGHESEDGKSRVTGTFYVDFDAAKDVAAGEENFTAIWDGSDGYGDPAKLDIGAEAEVRTKTEEDAHDVAVGYRFGNVTGIARISLNVGPEYAEPSQEMLTNVLIDVIYSGLN